MPMMYRLTQHVFLNGMSLPGEPFAAIGPDEDGDFLIFAAEPIDIPNDPTKASETAGTIAEFPPQGN
jgi:hypothetical protein